MYCDRALSSVVLPLPVPPEIRILTLAFMHAARNLCISAVIEPLAMRSWPSKERAEAADRYQSAVQSQRSGMMAFKRLPSGNRASTIGQVSSTRSLPRGRTIRCTTCSKCRLARETSNRFFPAVPAVR